MRPVNKWYLFAMACALACAGSSSAADAEARRDDGWLCASTDSAAACLLKVLLKNVPLLAAANRRRDPPEADGALKQPAATAVQSKGVEEYLLRPIRNLFGLFPFGFDLPAEVSGPWTLLKSSLFARGKKNKNLGPMMAAGFAVMAGTLVPLAFGALFMLAGKALTTSLLAITLSGLLGLKSLFGKQEGGGGRVKAYASLPVIAPPHYASETLQQYEQELGLYRGQTEAKMHASESGEYYGAENNRQSSAGHYGAASGERSQQTPSSDRPERAGRPELDDVRAEHPFRRPYGDGAEEKNDLA